MDSSKKLQTGGSRGQKSWKFTNVLNGWFLKTIKMYFCKIIKKINKLRTCFARIGFGNHGRSLKSRRKVPPKDCNKFSVNFMNLIQNYSERRLDYLATMMCEKGWQLSVNLALLSIVKMVFCFENCLDLQKEKNVLVIEKNFWNSRLKAKNLQTFRDHLNNLFE